MKCGRLIARAWCLYEDARVRLPVSKIRANQLPARCLLAEANDSSDEMVPCKSPNSGRQGFGNLALPDNLKSYYPTPCATPVLAFQQPMNHTSPTLPNKSISAVRRFKQCYFVLCSLEFC
jgi:hypothetical protein